MPDLDFPTSPIVNQIYSHNGRDWKWNGAAWQRTSATETGNTEGNTGEVAYYGTVGTTIKGATGFIYDSTTHGISAAGDLYIGGGATFANDIKVNDLTVGKGGGNVNFNTVLGEDALYSNELGQQNVAIGHGALYSNTGGHSNTALGFYALKLNTLGHGNNAIGHWALFSNTDGNYNDAVGYHALYNNTVGSYNVALGYRALYSNTEGAKNIASGYQALYSNTEGDNNVASGFGALQENTGGNDNTATGYLALTNNTEGNDNTAIGKSALTVNTIGASNTALGNYSLKSNTGGDYNIGVGWGAGDSIVGDKNTAIGVESAKDRYNDFTGTNNTFIGYNAQPSSATVSNEIVLGDSNVTLIHSAAGMSMGGGATFGGDVNFLGNLIVQEDKEISIGGDTEKIVFNGSGGIIRLGATEIQIDRYISHYGDTNTWMEWPSHDAFRMQLGGTEIIAATPTSVHIPVGISADAGATFGSDVVFQGGISADAGATFGGDVVFQGGISAAGGATFGGDVNFLGNAIVATGGFLQWPDGTTQSKAAITSYSANTGSVYTVWDINDNQFDISSSDFTVSLIPGNQMKYVLAAGANMVMLDASNGNIFEEPIGTYRYAGNENAYTTYLAKIDHATSTYMGITGGLVNFKILGTHILDMDSDIHAFVGISADAGATFGGDVNFQGNILITDDSFIGAGPGDERIIFDSSGNDITLSTNEVYFPNKLTHNGDDDTYISFTTDNVSLQAGGTDVLNITSSGADFGDNEVQRPKLKDYAETVNAIGTVTDDTDIDFENGNVQTVTVGGNCEFSFNHPPATGIAGTITLIITNGGAHTTTWESVVKWPGDNAPALTSSGVDIVSFMTIDAGDNIYGFVGGINFS
jgi:hypothetical protein